MESFKESFRRKVSVGSLKNSKHVGDITQLSLQVCILCISCGVNMLMARPLYVYIRTFGWGYIVNI